MVYPIPTPFQSILLRSFCCGLSRSSKSCSVLSCAVRQEEMRVELDHPPQLESLKKEVVVQPVDVAKRIMAIREQLAVEWTEDLANIEVRLVQICILVQGTPAGSF